MMRMESSPLIDKMRQGHMARTGHELVAHLESEFGDVWTVVRECCDTNPAAKFTADMSLDAVQKSLDDMPDGAQGSDMHRALAARLAELQQPA